MTNHDDECLRKCEVYALKWKRRTTVLGVALALNIVCIIPFLDGHFLHQYFERGRYLIYVACGLLSIFLGAAALTYNSWLALRNFKKDL